jgi:hypothetical protein
MIYLCFLVVDAIILALDAYEDNIIHTKIVFKNPKERLSFDMYLARRLMFLC